MLIILKDNSQEQGLDSLLQWLDRRGLGVEQARAGGRMVLAVTGDITQADAQTIAALPMVETVGQREPPCPLAGRRGRGDTVVMAGGVAIGGGGLTLMAGPCSVESGDQVLAVARSVQAGGAALLRGGAFKPRTSPYAFQGLGPDGLAMLARAKADTGLPIVSEIMDAAHLPYFDGVDLIQVGARNMQNYTLLRELGRQDKPVLLKRGLSATYEELIMSAETIMAAGNSRVILCERGIRTFEPYTRSTLDIAAIPALKHMTHLPVVVDPSHAAGRWELVSALSLAAVAAGADGLLIEVHNDPGSALCDGPQSLKPHGFHALAGQLLALHRFLKGGAAL